MILRVEKVSKRFPGVRALDEVSIEVRRLGEIIGLAGENGAGKSTLLKIMAGIYSPDSGEMFLNSEPFKPKNYRDAVSKGVSLVFQEQALVPNLFAYENIFLSHEYHFTKCGILQSRRMMAEAKYQFEKMEINVDPTEVTSNYSIDERQMIEICKAFTLSDLYGVSKPIILLDEPTSGLNQEHIKTLLRKLNQFRNKASFIFVSHRLSELMELCDRIYVLKDGENTAEIDPNQTDEEHLHELMVGRKAEKEFYKESLQLVGTQGNEEVLVVQNLADREGAFRGVSFGLRKGEILGIGGVLGCGKLELGRAIAGVRGIREGSVAVKGEKVSKHSLAEMIKRGVGYVPKERKTEGIIPYFSVAWNMTLALIADSRQWGSTLLSEKRENGVASEYLTKLKVKAPSLATLCYSLSGGNQQKVVLAKWLATKPEVLIMDNPTRGIDVGAKEEIYGLIRELTEEGLAILLITDDLLELIGLSNRIIIMKDGEVTFAEDTPSDRKPTEQQVIRYMV